MWADLKMNHASATRTRGEIVLIVMAVAVISVLMWTISSLARGQVQKAELRDAARQSQRVEMARCWQESAGPQAMRNCMTDVQVQTAQVIDRSYGLAQQPVARDETQNVPVAASGNVSGGVSMISMRY